MSVSERKFGILQTGETVKIFHLENKSGAYAEVTDFGAILLNELYEEYRLLRSCGTFC